ELVDHLVEHLGELDLGAGLHLLPFLAAIADARESAVGELGERRELFAGGQRDALEPEFVEHFRAIAEGHDQERTADADEEVQLQLAEAFAKLVELAGFLLDELPGQVIDGNEATVESERIEIAADELGLRPAALEARIEERQDGCRLIE